MLPIITDLIEWINNLKFAAHRMIIDDTILQSAPPLFRQCSDIAIKTDGVYWCYRLPIDNYLAIRYKHLQGIITC